MSSPLMSTYFGWAVALLICVSACGGPVRAPPAADAELIVFGAGPGGVREACFTCHGLAGEGAGDAPRLAGLNAGYLNKQMSDYANGRRADAIMAPIARRLGDADRRAVSDYYARMPTPVRALGAAPHIYTHGDSARGLRACAECHGADAEGVGAGNPGLAGQPAAYTAAQLRNWKRGLRRNDPRDEMGAAARALSDAEIETLAAYLADSSP